jgi:excinuclease ABC subunit C
VEVAVPVRGEKREVVAAALQNAREQLIRSLAESASQRALLEGVAAAFSLDAPPKRIEVYDNSHIQGAHAVGAMIVAGPEGFEKSEYRKFNIKSADLAPGDDLAMMREVLSRRFGRLMREGENTDDKWNKWPDLVLIDGGQRQVDAAYAALNDVGAGDAVIVGMAKSIERESGREHFCRHGQPPFRLDEKSPVLYFLQRLRDEAHRFAIGGHRKKRAKAIGASPLDEIAGVGRARKKALLSHFGSARAVAQASLSDLHSVAGVSSALARKIYEFFHPE